VNLDTLKLYCDVVRLRSFSRGAAANGVSQSAASQSIQQLEAELDLPLLDRSRRPLQPTEEGHTFYEACRTLLQGFEKARAELQMAKQRVEGTARVAAIYSVGLHDMSRHMQPFMSAYPHARVLLECLHPHKVVEAVLNDEADLGVLSYPAATRALEVLPLRSEPMVLVAHPTHRLARRRSLVAADLTGEKFVAFDHDLAIRKAIDRVLKQHGVKVDVVMEFDNVETIKQAISINAGLSVLPRPTILKELGMRTVVALPLAFPDQVKALANKSIDASVTTEPFIQDILAKDVGVVFKRMDEFIPNQQTAVVMFSPKFASNTDLATRWMVAYVKGVRMFNDAFTKKIPAARDEAVDLLVKRTDLKDKAGYDKAVMPGIDPDGKLNVDDLKAQQDFYIAQGEQKDRIDVEKTVDASLTEAAVKTLGGPYK